MKQPSRTELLAQVVSIKSRIEQINAMNLPSIRDEHGVVQIDLFNKLSPEQKEAKGELVDLESNLALIDQQLKYARDYDPFIPYRAAKRHRDAMLERKGKA